MKHHSGEVAAIVLAAGSSKRMGRAKQLLPWRGETLVRRAVLAAVAAVGDASAVVVVVGASAEACVKELSDLGVRWVLNKSWMNGMHSSLCCGVRAIMGQNYHAALITTCDQPLVDGVHLRRLMDTYLVGDRSLDAPTLVATEYQERLGVPALFHRSLWPELIAAPLPGHEDQGARAVLAKHRSAAVAIPLPEASFDIDTEADYVALRNKEAPLWTRG